MDVRNVPHTAAITHIGLQRDTHFLSTPLHPRISAAAFSTPEFSSHVFLTLPHFAVTLFYLPPLSVHFRFRLQQISVQC